MTDDTERPWSVEVPSDWLEVPVEDAKGNVDHVELVPPGSVTPGQRAAWLRLRDRHIARLQEERDALAGSWRPRTAGDGAIPRAIFPKNESEGTMSNEAAHSARFTEPPMTKALSPRIFTHRDGKKVVEFDALGCPGSWDATFFNMVHAERDAHQDEHAPSWVVGVAEKMLAAGSGPDFTYEGADHLGILPGTWARGTPSEAALAGLGEYGQMDRSSPSSRCSTHDLHVSEHRRHSKPSRRDQPSTAIVRLSRVWCGRSSRSTASPPGAHVFRHPARSSSRRSSGYLSPHSQSRSVGARRS